ncbi:MAG: hypothetical protein BECKG1743D_GA0114223_101115 [Candidatus Kentron sp. G]|nr:MAG: hypothetical protein BECKG1743F_GA0114225_101333 [Candidatus Kentron sp. G]VFM97231.1 MAG: hypothetical protein BECKG1743E_GA0114224_101204 [Candidatus Kentron sp. G]VFM99262.1 MAG: hypothetical protein BECKG1743D_GA0114223_101115 [Candidatus Kentron sp. G]
MRVLFDQGTPVPLRHHLPGHQISTAHELGWSNIENGELLRRAESHGFEILVTTDANLRYQQNLAKAISIKEYTNLLVFIVQLLRCNNSYIVHYAPVIAP